MRNPPLHCLTMLLGLAASVLAGCGDGQAYLGGTVTIDGKPAPAGTAFTLVPTDGGTVAYGQTDEDGHYTVSASFQQPGFPPGRYTLRMMPGAGGARPPAVNQTKPTLLPDQRKPHSGKYPKAWYREIDQLEVKAGRNRHDIVLLTPAVDDVAEDAAKPRDQADPAQPVSDR